MDKILFYSEMLASELFRMEVLDSKNYEMILSLDTIRSKNILLRVFLTELLKFPSVYDKFINFMRNKHNLLPVYFKVKFLSKLSHVGC